jgi:outer membrane protein TolC
MKIVLPLRPVGGWSCASGVALLLLVGCYSYPPVPEPVEGNSYTAVPVSQHRGLPENCTLLTMTKARETALLNNPDFRSTRHAMAAANARFYRSLTEHLPQVTASYDYMESRYPSDSVMGQAGVRTATTKTTGFNADWLVFNGLSQTMGTLAARHDARQSEAVEKDAQRLLLEAVGIAYNQVLLARAGIGIAKEDEIFNRKLLKETELKYEAGAVALSEVLNFRIRVNEARSYSVRAEYSFATARAILAELLGLTVGTIEPELFPPLEDAVPTPELGVDVHLDTALASRPDLVAYREALKAARYRLYARYGAFSPQVVARADFGWQRFDLHSKGRGHLRNRREDRFLSYGGTASWDLLQMGGRWFDLREAQAVVAERQESLTAGWIGVVAEVRQAHDNLHQQTVQVAIATETLELVRKTRDLVEEEYKAGNTSLTRLNEAQRDFIVNEAGLVTARINLANARLTLAAVTAVDPVLAELVPAP